MNNLEKAKELKEKFESLMGDSTHGNCCTCEKCRNWHDDCTCEKRRNIKNNVRELLREIEKGCEKMYGEYKGIKDYYFCNGHGLCEDCIKAKEICREILK